MAPSTTPLGPDIRERVRAYVANAGQLRQTATSIAGRVRAHSVGSVTDALEELVTEGELQKEERPEREPIYSKGLAAWFAAGRAADLPSPPPSAPDLPPRGPSPPPGRGHPPQRGGR